MADTASGLSVEDALGTGEYAWKSPDGTRSCTYAKPKGVITPLISACLGPANASNEMLHGHYRALLAIRTWTGPDPKTGKEETNRVVSPSDPNAFAKAIARFGDDDDADARFNDYVGQALQNLYGGGNEVDTAKK